MAEFIELTERDGEKIMVNIDFILKVFPDEEGAYIFFNVATGSGNSTSLDCVHVRESYAAVKRILK